MSKHCLVGNMSQKQAFSSSTSSFKLLCLRCLSVRAETAGAVLLFMSRFRVVSATKPGKKEKKASGGKEVKKKKKKNGAAKPQIERL